MRASSQVLDRIAVSFDDEHAVASAGLVLPATTSQKLGLEAPADELVGVGYRPGRKAATVVHAMAAGGDCIDDVDVLRAGATERLVGHGVAAPSTVGMWLREFTFGHVRQLDRLAETLLTRAWAAGAGPGDQPLVIDVDSTVCEVHGYAKQGAAFGCTRQRGYHPMLATRSDTGETLHARQRKGSANTARGAQRFVRETIGRVRRAGAAGPITLRADSGYWSKEVIEACQAHGVRFSLTVRNVATVREAIDEIPESSWAAIDYTDQGFAQVAETGLDGHRLIIRRTRIDHPDQQLFDDWRHHAFVTDATGDAVELDAFHRGHAVCELAIRDFKAEGLAHTPSGVFNANAAWLVLATLAHNLLRYDRPARRPRPRRLGRQDPPPTPPGHPRTADPLRTTMAPGAARPLALAQRVPRRARTDPRTYRWSAALLVASRTRMYCNSCPSGWTERTVVAYPRG